MTKMSRLAPIVGMLATACASYPFQLVPEGETTVLHQRSHITATSQVDIVMVVDDSLSMGDEQAGVAKNAKAFIDALTATQVNYHLGILTTDLLAPTDGGRLRSAAGAAAFLAAPDPNAADAATQRQGIVDAFVATISSLGIYGNTNEAGIAAVIAALQPTNPAVAERNAGFLRPNADLAVVVISDEDDCSAPPAIRDTVAAWKGDSDCYIKTNFLYDSQAMVDALASIKGNDPSRVRLGIIAGGARDENGVFAARGCRIEPTNGAATAACGCWASSPNPFFCTSLSSEFGQPCSAWASCDFAAGMCPSTTNASCDTPVCQATPARRYEGLATALGDRRAKAGNVRGTFIDSICQSDYHESLLKIVSDVVDTGSCFALPEIGLGPSDVRLNLKRNGVERPVPRLGDDAGAACNSCDGVCAQGAWRLGPTGACLACGLVKQVDDTFDIAYVAKK